MSGKISELTEATVLGDADLLEVTVDPAGTPASRKATVATVRAKIAPRATAAEYLAATGGKVIEPDDAWDAAVPKALTDGSTIVFASGDTGLDFSKFINAYVTIAGNRTLGAPQSAKPGQKGEIEVVENGTGGWTLAFATGYVFGVKTAPAITTTANARNVLPYTVLHDGKVLIGALKDAG